MAQKVKEFIDKYKLSVIILFVGIGFLLAGFLVPPVGTIDPTVLTAVGEIFAFCAAITGLDTYATNSFLRLKDRSKKEENNDEK